MAFSNEGKSYLDDRERMNAAKANGGKDVRNTGKKKDESLMRCSKRILQDQILFPSYPSNRKALIVRMGGDDICLQARNRA